MSQYHEPHVDAETNPADPEGRNGEALLNKFCADFGVREAEALEFLEWMEENHSAPAPNSPAHGEFKIIEKLKIFLLAMFRAQPSVTNFAYYQALNIPWVDDILGGMNQAEFAKYLLGKKVNSDLVVSQTKANVSKACRLATADLRRRGLGLERRRNVRTEASCDKSRHSRNEFVAKQKQQKTEL